MCDLGEGVVIDVNHRRFTFQWCEEVFLPEQDQQEYAERFSYLKTALLHVV